MEEIVKRSKKYKTYIVSLLVKKPEVTTREILRVVPRIFIKKELEILQYYGVAIREGNIVKRGENFGKIDIEELPSSCMINFKPHEKIVYEVIKEKECTSYMDIATTLWTYGVAIHHMTVGKIVRDLIDRDMVERIHIGENFHIYRAKYNMFIPPGDFEEKIKDAIRYLKQWEVHRKYDYSKLDVLGDYEEVGDNDE